MFLLFTFSNVPDPPDLYERVLFLSNYKLMSVSAVRPGSVRNIIQQFENHTETGEEGGDAADPQRLSSSSLGEDSMER